MHCTDTLCGSLPCKQTAESVRPLAGGAKPPAASGAAAGAFLPHLCQRSARGSCRCGNPLLSADLDKVSCAEARSIIVLATAGAPQQSDARVLRITLSLLGLHDRLHNEGLPGLQVLWALLSIWSCTIGQVLWVLLSNWTRILGQWPLGSVSHRAEQILVCAIHGEEVM